MAAIRRSFSGALQRRRSASMTPEQKTEETKLERLTERFERGMRNLKTLEARLITVSGCVEIKFYGAFVLNHRVVPHAIDAAPARWRGDTGSSPLDRASTVASSPRNDLVKNYRVHATHWLISTQVAALGGTWRCVASWLITSSRW